MKQQICVKEFHRVVNTLFAVTIMAMVLCSQWSPFS